MLYLKNSTISETAYLGIVFAPGEYRPLSNSLRVEFSDDPGVVAAVSSGSLVVSYKNDGTADLPAATGLIALNSSNTLTTEYVSSTSSTSTSSGTYSVIGGMTITPIEGDYIAFFSAKANTTGVNAQCEYGLFVDNTIVADSKRELSCSITLLGIITVSLNAIGVDARTSSKITLNGSQTISVKYRSVNGVAVSFGERSLTLIKVS